MAYKYRGDALYGLSSDTKPNGEQGAPLVEVDTGKVYIWIDDKSAWFEVGGEGS